MRSPSLCPQLPLDFCTSVARLKALVDRNHEFAASLINVTSLLPLPFKIPRLVSESNNLKSTNKDEGQNLRWRTDTSRRFGAEDATMFEVESLSLRALRVKASVWRYETFHLALCISSLFLRVLVQLIGDYYYIDFATSSLSEGMRSKEKEQHLEVVSTSFPLQHQAMRQVRRRSLGAVYGDSA